MSEIKNIQLVNIQVTPSGSVANYTGKIGEKDVTFQIPIVLQNVVIS